MTFEEFKSTLPESVTSDMEKLLAVCKAADVNVPLENRFYIKTHTPKKSAYNPEPQPTEYVVIPHPLGGRDFWVRKQDFSALLDGANTFRDTLGS
jgi:hypothetical protein